MTLEEGIGLIRESSNVDKYKDIFREPKFSIIRENVIKLDKLIYKRREIKDNQYKEEKKLNDTLEDYINNIKYYRHPSFQNTSKEDKEKHMKVINNNKLIMETNKLTRIEKQIKNLKQSTIDKANFIYGEDRLKNEDIEKIILIHKIGMIMFL